MHYRRTYSTFIPFSVFFSSFSPNVLRLLFATVSLLIFSQSPLVFHCGQYFCTTLFVLLLNIIALMSIVRFNSVLMFLFLFLLFLWSCGESVSHIKSKWRMVCLRWLVRSSVCSSVCFNVVA